MANRLLLLALGMNLAQGTSATLIAAEAKSPCRVYIGTYTGGTPGSKGIYSFDLDLQTGEVGPATLAGSAINPAFLAIHPNHRTLYAVSEIAEFRGSRTGAVIAFSIGAESGALTLLDQQPSGGAGPCHLDTDHQGRCLLVANYAGGTVAAFPLSSSGQIEPATAVIEHQGRSVHPQRQTKPYAHCITPSPGDRFALACDLGADRIFVYSLDAAKARLAAHEPASVPLPPGSGPRHLAFHPAGRLVLAVNELNSTVTSFVWDGQLGTLKEIETVSTLPPGVTNANTTAEIEVHPNGRFVYASNRGHDSLAVLVVDTATGRLSLAGLVPSGGKTPRSFGITPGGRRLLVANQGSGEVVLFDLDPASGRLQPTGKSVAVPSPVCVKFVPQP